ncbi:MAG: response regulator, partial [Nitrospira sp.]|nr:response regulator [Nitrospira sp.]
ANSSVRAMGAHRDLFGLHKDGREIPVEIGLTPLVTTDGPHVLASIVDITARKQAEQLLQQAHAELEHRVEVRTAELVRANEALEGQMDKREQLERQLRQSQKMEALGRLASGVAHDFNNLLTIIKGYSDMMLAKSDLRKDVQSSLEQIKKATDRATGLTQQLLSFSRSREVEVKVVDVNGLISNVASLLQRLVGERIRFDVVLTDQPCWVKLDPVGFEQVLINLVVNARDAMLDGGQVTIRTIIDDQVNSDEKLWQPGSGDRVLVTVSDTGSGMDAATQARIFEPFYTTKPPGKGTGLGLATVYQVVEQSGGTIAVVSAPGAGTTFSLTFPRGAAADAVPVTPVKASDGRGAETVLLAEDDLQVRALLTAVLTGAGYRVLEAGDGIEGLAVAQAHSGPIHILLTDGVMPEMNGWDLARELSRLRPGVRVLFLTGYLDTVIPEHAMLENQGKILHKPVTNDVLIRTIRESLDGSVTGVVADELERRAWRILVMDDDAQIRTLIRDLLKREPHQVWSCATGAEARNYLRTSQADVVLVDMLLSDIHDLEAIQAIRRERPNLSIIAMSDSGTVSPEFSVAFAKQIGAVSILAKPFSKRDLLQVIDVTLARQPRGRASRIVRP